MFLFFSSLPFLTFQQELLINSCKQGGFSSPPRHHAGLQPLGMICRQSRANVSVFLFVRLITFTAHTVSSFNGDSHRPVVDGKCRYIRFLHKTVPEQQCEQCKQGGDNDRTPLYDERRPVVDDPPHAFASQFKVSGLVVFFPFLHVCYSSIWFFTRR